VPLNSQWSKLFIDLVFGADRLGNVGESVFFQEIDQAEVYLHDKAGAFVDHAGDQLKQTGTEGDFGVSVLCGEDASTANDDKFLPVIFVC